MECRGTMYGYTNPTIRSTEDGEQVGPKMHSAVKLCDGRVWQSMNDLATTVGPNGSSQFGYRIIKRCQRKGLISYPDPEHEKANPHGRGAIYATDKGQRYLEREA